MKKREEYIRLLKNHAGDFKNQYGITMMRLFGSVARDEQHEGSDVDLFVEMPPRLFLMAGAQRYLKNLLGCEVDMVRNHSHIDKYLLSQIEKDGVQVF